MTKNNHRALTPLLPKNEKGNFFTLSAFLLLLAASFTVIFGISDFHGNSIISAFAQHIIIIISSFSTIALSIFCIHRKNYRILVSAGCILLLATYLCLIFEIIDIATISCLLTSAIILLIPAINLSICQLGSPQRASQRLSFAYVLPLPIIFAVISLFTFIANNTTLDLLLFAKILYSIFCLLILLLWRSSYKKNIWIQASTEDEICGYSSHPRRAAMLLLLRYMIILTTLWWNIIYIVIANMRGSDVAMITIIASICLGLFFACYRNKNAGISRIINKVAAFSASLNLLFLVVILTGLISFETVNSNLVYIFVIINIFFSPLCLTNCRCALLEKPYPKNKGWVHFFLLLIFPASAVCIANLYYLSSMLF